MLQVYGSPHPYGGVSPVLSHLVLFQNSNFSSHAFNLVWDLFHLNAQKSNHRLIEAVPFLTTDSLDKHCMGWPGFFFLGVQYAATIG
ncbi:MAG: hypothetical protein MUF49_02590 [Oculatellaceae cyanobacterium Prado106]|jgi:hypothetical protein|nr:hypothetical protein [Oculatellaceae cyanobacterium Prado106]